MNQNNENETAIENMPTRKEKVPFSLPSRPNVNPLSLSQSLKFYRENTTDVPVTPPAFLPSKPVEQLRTQKSEALRGDSREFYYSADTVEVQTPKSVPTPLQDAKNNGLNTEEDRRFSEIVETYTDWLVRQATRPLLKKDQEEKELYIQESMHPVQKGGQEVLTFAPFRFELSALQTFTRKQISFFVLLGCLWLAGLFFLRVEMITIAIGMITGIYTLCLCINVVLSLRIANEQTEEHFDERLIQALGSAPWPKYTILCPLYKEAKIIPQFVDAMSKLEYPTTQLQILLLTEEADKETRKAIRALHLPDHFEMIVVPEGQPRTKPRACNYGLLKATGEYIVIFDAEDIPDPYQLKKAVLSFANNDINTVCVQAKLNFYNTNQNLLTRWFTAEYSTWFSFVLPALQKAGFMLPLGGTSNHFRTASLRALGGWDAYNVTEDCDLGLRLKKFNMKTVVLDSTTLEEANPNLKNWFRQRSRWIKGYMQTYLVHTRTPLKTIREGNLKDVLSFHVVIGSGIGVLFFNPLMWMLLALYMIKGPVMIDLYHELFPGPLLYMGAFCLIFGNFFYVYLYLLGCARGEKYGLLPWTLFIPVYWFLMSIAGIYAFLELLIKPHYWQKTIHGFTVKGESQKIPSAPLSQETEATIPVIPIVKKSTPRLIRSITTSMKAMGTLPLPAISFHQKQAEKTTFKTKTKDIWLVMVILFSSTTSVLSLLYYLNAHEIILYQDALSHMRIARAVFDNITPGIAQLGSVWLPLPHVLMWPFIWNNTLWHSGLAGSFVSMICYILSCSYLYLSIKKLTKNTIASFIGTSIFLLNPNVLYLQTTPLSELVCLATSILSCYFFLTWIERDTLSSLIKTAIFVFLATLSRYDGWPLFLALFLFIGFISLVRKKSFLYTQGRMLLFGAIGGMGIILWLVWNKIIFGDPLYFQHSTYSSQAQQLAQLLLGNLYTYHNALLSIKYYAIDTQQIIGYGLALFLLLGFIWFFARNKPTLLIFGFLAFFVPFAFYSYALYNGNAIIWIPGANPPLSNLYMYNVRYGVQMVPAAAVAIAFLIKDVQKIKLRQIKVGLNILFLLLIFAQSGFTQIRQGVVSVQDGQYNVSCQAQKVPTLVYLAEHYNGGYVLQDVFTSGYDVTDSGVIDFHDVIYEGSGQFWTHALQHPEQYAEWVLANPHNKLDLVAKHINFLSPAFVMNYSAVEVQTNGITLYKKIRGLPEANRSTPPVYTYPHFPCTGSL